MSWKEFHQFRAYENSHIALWIVKDFCWCCGYHVLGMGMIIPTLIVAIDILRLGWKDVHERYHNFTICMWIMANATWMTGEFFFDDSFRPYAKIFFIVGIVATIYYYLVLFRKRTSLVEE